MRQEIVEETHHNLSLLATANSDRGYRWLAVGAFPLMVRQSLRTGLSHGGSVAPWADDSCPDCGKSVPECPWVIVETQIQEEWCWFHPGHGTIKKNYLPCQGHLGGQAAYMCFVDCGLRPGLRGSGWDIVETWGSVAVWSLYDWSHWHLHGGNWAPSSLSLSRVQLVICMDRISMGSFEEIPHYLQMMWFCWSLFHSENQGILFGLGWSFCTESTKPFQSKKRCSNFWGLQYSFCIQTLFSLILKDSFVCFGSIEVVFCCCFF